MSVVVLAALGVGAGVAAAQSSTGRSIRDLGRTLLYVAIPVTLVTEGFLFYAIWKFRKNDDPSPTKENRRLEITWTVATAFILLFVGTTAYAAMAQPTVTPSQSRVEHQLQQEETTVVNVTGAQWYWKVSYPEHGISTRNTLVLPAGRPVVFRIRSADVVHSVFIPELGLKKDAVPGMTNYLSTRVSKDAAGNTYDLYCAEYCGTGHSDMVAKVHILAPQQYQQWLNEQAGSATSGTGTTTSTSNATSTSSTTGTNETTSRTATATK